MSFLVSRFLFLLKILKTFKRNNHVFTYAFCGTVRNWNNNFITLLNIAFKNQSEEQSRIEIYVDQIFNYLSINPTIEILLLFIFL